MNTATKFFLALLTLGLCSSLAASPQIQHWQTSNGARVYFVPAPELPLLDLRITFDAGAARDAAHPGLALLSNSLIGEGAGKLDADAIAESFDQVGARFSASAQRDMASLGLRSLTEPALLAPALDTFALLLHQPSFPTDALERQRRQMLTVLQNQRQRPGEIASRAFHQALYGDHPYASPPSGTEASVSSLSRDQVVAFHRQYYVARNAVIAMVGALERSDAEAIAERLSAGLAAGAAAAALPPVAELSSAHQEHIPHQASQTHVLLGQPGIARGDADYFPLYVGNQILGGGGLVSRINEAVREKRGLSYSAASYFQPMRANGPFTLSLQTRNDNTTEALAVLRETLQRFVANGPSEAELAAAKRNLSGGFALNTDSNSKILGYLGMIGFYRLPLDYLETFIPQVEAVSTEQIREAFQRRIAPERLVQITVGGNGD
ncbi:MAG: M16 family metallopeptidase [Thiohalomonadaceae bacterium]